MIDFNGFDKGVIGKKLPSDTTLNNMCKADLIKLLHIADHNHKVLAEAYRIAVYNSKCNTCPLGSKKADHDKKIRDEVIEQCMDVVPFRIDDGDYSDGFNACSKKILDRLAQMKGEQNE